MQIQADHERKYDVFRLMNPDFTPIHERDFEMALNEVVAKASKNKKETLIVSFGDVGFLPLKLGRYVIEFVDKASEMGKKIIVTRLPDEMASLLKAGLTQKGAGFHDSVEDAVRACMG
jgi:hypothetical protein